MDEMPYSAPLSQAEGLFAQDLLAGLTSSPKTLPCKWFYDRVGSELFEAITGTPEYYLTRDETTLLGGLVSTLHAHLPKVRTVIEPGSGAGIKTRLLLQGLPALRRFIPIDISADFLLQAAHHLQHDFPQLAIEPCAGDFTAHSLAPALQADEQVLVFFPGSTIGNFSPAEAESLLKHFRNMGGRSPHLLIGVDMTQDPDRLLPAYDDSAGITARFNRNILARANRELGTAFPLGDFRHEARFNAAASRMEMHLVATSALMVQLDGRCIRFAPGESIHTENCYKYAQSAFENLLAAGGWQAVQQWTAPTSGFSVWLCKARGDTDDGSQ